MAALGGRFVRLQQRIAAMGRCAMSGANPGDRLTRLRSVDRWMPTTGAAKLAAMNSELIGSQITRSWRRCATCGRFFSFPQWGRAPRDCSCGSVHLVPSSPRFSFWRLMGE